LLRVVYLGRLVEHKRPQILVQRWKELSGATGLYPARLDIYGFDPVGNMLKGLRAYIAETGQTNTIRVHGEYDLHMLPEILGQTDLVVLPSLLEGLPLVLVEAMLRGVPFVSCAAGGTEELAEGNPDASVTGTEWRDFEDGLLRMARKIRGGEIDPVRLHNWAEQRYGYTVVSQQWIKCLHDARGFFAEQN
jgi:glycosyltransferase involved in cell wall biosynthesis